MDAGSPDQSTSVIRWALKQRGLRAKHKVVLVAIAAKARRVDDEDFAWVSVCQLAAMTGRSRGGVAYSIEYLKNVGLIRHLHPHQIHLPSGIPEEAADDPHELEYEWRLRTDEVFA